MICGRAFGRLVRTDSLRGKEVDDLIADGVANAEALQLFVEIELAKLGVHIGTPDTSDADTASYLKRLLERFRREQRNAALARVSPEPIDRWTAALIRKAHQILGEEQLSRAVRGSYLDALRAGLPAADTATTMYCRSLCI